MGLNRAVRASFEDLRGLESGVEKLIGQIKRGFKKGTFKRQLWQFLRQFSLQKASAFKTPCKVFILDWVSFSTPDRNIPEALRG